MRMTQRTRQRLAAECVACSAGLPNSVPPDRWCFHDHEQVLLATQDGHVVSVDQGMVNLVEHLWKYLWHLGIKTVASCQGGMPTGDRPYIVLDATADHAEAVAEAVTLFGYDHGRFAVVESHGRLRIAVLGGDP